jgi:hypothetical protein
MGQPLQMTLQLLSKPASKLQSFLNKTFSYIQQLKSLVLVTTLMRPVPTLQLTWYSYIRTVFSSRFLQKSWKDEIIWSEKCLQALHKDIFLLNLETEPFQNPTMPIQSSFYSAVHTYSTCQSYTICLDWFLFLICNVPCLNVKILYYTLIVLLHSYNFLTDAILFLDMGGEGSFFYFVLFKLSFTYIPTNQFQYFSKNRLRDYFQML